MGLLIAKQRSQGPTELWKQENKSAILTLSKAGRARSRLVALPTYAAMGERRLAMRDRAAWTS